MKDPVRAAWRGHKFNSIDRGIDFKFSFEEWVVWWEAELGPDWFQKRGCRKGQFVMARFKDKGTYEPGNVKCVTSGSNIAEFNARRDYGSKQRPRMGRDEVVAIFKSTLKYSILAKKHNITTEGIQRIKRRKNYRQFTDELPRPGLYHRNPFR